MNKLELIELNDNQIKSYIGKKHFENIVNNSLLRLLRNPMLLTMYNKTCTYINKSSNLYKFKLRVQTPGELLWNYFEGAKNEKA